MFLIHEDLLSFQDYQNMQYFQDSTILFFCVHSKRSRLKLIQDPPTTAFQFVHCWCLRPLQTCQKYEIPAILILNYF